MPRQPGHSSSSSLMGRWRRICSCGKRLPPLAANWRFSVYSYIPLSSPSCFRVLVLAPGGVDEPLRGSIKELDLAVQYLQYKALSYTWIRREQHVSAGRSHLGVLSVHTKPETQSSFKWEEQPKPHHIIIDNTTILPTTCNLQSALIRLRSPGESIIIFVDALSIDQSTSETSLKERSQQIRSMRDIFHRAETVLADLGEDDDGAVSCLETIQDIASIDRDLWYACQLDGKGYDGLLSSSTISTPEFWQSFLALCRRPWWRRLWVIQEVIVAKQAIFHIDGHNINESQLITGMNRAWHYATSGNNVLVQSGQLRVAVFSECRQACLSIYRLRELMEGNPHRNFLETGLPIVAIMAFIREFKTTAPHDQIFALMGLAERRDRENINVDYTIPYSETLTHFSQHVIGSDTWWQTLLHLLPWEKSDLIPSWVLDPSRTTHDVLDQSFLHGQSSAAYRAGGRGSAPSSFDADTKQICMLALAAGCLVDLTELFPSFMTESDASYKTVKSRLRKAKTMYVRTTLKLEEDAATVSMHNFWSTLTGGQRLSFVDSKYFLQDLATYIEAFEEWCFDTHSSETLPAAGDPMFIAGHHDRVEKATKYMIAICGDRYLAATSDGRLCLVPTTTRLHDKVFVFPGLDMPFVVREKLQTHENKGNSRKAYTLVGSAYVQGIMDGELLDEQMNERIEDIWLA